MSSFELLERDHIEQILPLVAHLNPDKEIALLKSRLETMFTHSSYRCFGLRAENGALIAVSSVWITTRLYSGKQAEVDNVVVSPEQRGKGIGRVLMNGIEEWAKVEGCISIELNAYLENVRAHDFYEDLGFKKLGFHMAKGATCGH